MSIHNLSDRRHLRALNSQHPNTHADDTREEACIESTEYLRAAIKRNHWDALFRNGMKA